MRNLLHFIVTLQSLQSDWFFIFFCFSRAAQAKENESEGRTPKEKETGSRRPGRGDRVAETNAKNPFDHPMLTNLIHWSTVKMIHACLGWPHPPLTKYVFLKLSQVVTNL